MTAPTRATAGAVAARSGAATADAEYALYCFAQSGNAYKCALRAMSRRE